MSIPTLPTVVRKPQHFNPWGTTDVWAFEPAEGIDLNRFLAALGPAVSIRGSIRVIRTGNTKQRTVEGTVKLAGSGLTKVRRDIVYALGYGKFLGRIREAQCAVS